MEIAIIVAATIAGVIAETEEFDGKNHIPAHGGAGHHQLQVNQASHNLPCDNLVAVEASDGSVAYLTCKY